MGETNLIEVRQGLPASQTRAAAELYYEAFRQKLQLLLVTQEQGVRILQETLVPESTLVALRDGELVGLLAVLHGGRPFLRPRPSVYWREYGWLEGTIRFALIRSLRRWQHRNEVLVEGLVVQPALRGQGIGTRLLEEVFRYAREHSLGAVRLDVADTNPQAQRLYERLGFVAVKTRRFPLLGRLLGFSSVTTMLKRIETPA